MPWFKKPGWPRERRLGNASCQPFERWLAGVASNRRVGNSLFVSVLNRTRSKGCDVVVVLRSKVFLIFARTLIARPPGDDLSLSIGRGMLMFIRCPGNSGHAH